MRELLASNYKRSNYQFVSIEATVFEVEQMFREQLRLEAVLISKSGHPNGELVGIVRPRDLASIHRERNDAIVSSIFLISALLVGLDQWSKYLTVQNISLGETKNSSWIFVADPFKKYRSCLELIRRKDDILLCHHSNC